MGITTVSAHVSCSDLTASTAWYEKLFGKPPTHRPMKGLVEWRFTESAEVQLFEDASAAGKSTLTLGVTGLDSERERLVAAGLSPGEVEEATNFFLVRLQDPDGNLVVLAGAKR